MVEQRFGDRLLLYGKYVPETEPGEDAEHLSCDNWSDARGSGLLREMEISPIEMLGKIRAKFTSYLEPVDGDSLDFMYQYSTVGISEINKGTDVSLEKGLEFSFTLPISGIPKDKCRGYIEMELLPPSSWKYTQVFISPGNEGAEYEFEGVKFKIFKSAPGDVIFEYDSKDNEALDSWNFIPVKDGKLINHKGGYMNGGKDVLQYYQNPDMCFGEWCLVMQELNCESFGVTPNALKFATKDNYKPTQEELRLYQEAWGEIVGYYLTDNLKGVNTENYNDFYKQWIRKGYETAVEFDGN